MDDIICFAGNSIEIISNGVDCNIYGMHSGSCGRGCGSISNGMEQPICLVYSFWFSTLGYPLCCKSISKKSLFLPKRIKLYQFFFFSTFKIINTYSVLFLFLSPLLLVSLFFLLYHCCWWAYFIPAVNLFIRKNI